MLINRRKEYIFYDYVYEIYKKKSKLRMKEYFRRLYNCNF